MNYSNRTKFRITTIIEAYLAVPLGEVGVLLPGVVDSGVVELGVVELGVVELGVVELGVVASGREEGVVFMLSLGNLFFLLLGTVVSPPVAGVVVVLGIELSPVGEVVVGVVVDGADWLVAAGFFFIIVPVGFDFLLIALGFLVTFLLVLCWDAEECVLAALAIDIELSETSTNEAKAML